MRRLVVAMIVAGLVGVVTGLGQAGRVAPVLAGACGLHSSCPFGDTTRTSSLTVYHETTSNEAVEPDTGETWEITARYTLQTLGTACDCADRTVQATVEVDWTGSGWTATCTSGCGGAIAQVSVCDVSAMRSVVGPDGGLRADRGPGGERRVHVLRLPYTQFGKLIDVTYETTSKWMTATRSSTHHLRAG